MQVTDDFILDGGTWMLTEDQKGAADRQDRSARHADVPAGRRLPGGEAGPSWREHASGPTRHGLPWPSASAGARTSPSWPIRPRPDAPNIDDEQVSQIDDEEMARMNIEISAALAWWLALSGSDDRRYGDLVARALAYLPTGPKAVSALPSGDILLASTVPELAAQVRRSWPADRLDRDLETATKHGIRVIANTITHIAWRNGPIENVHAGQYLATA